MKGEKGWTARKEKNREECLCTQECARVYRHRHGDTCPSSGSKLNIIDESSLSFQRHKQTF